MGAGVLALALAHGEHRDVLVHFGVYAAIVFFFKARDAIRRVPMLVTQARASSTVLRAGPWWLRAARLVLGYDSWSRTERLGFAAIAIVVCTLFGWARGGPFAAALFLAVAVVNAGFALVHCESCDHNSQIRNCPTASVGTPGRPSTSPGPASAR